MIPTMKVNALTVIVCGTEFSENAAQAATATAALAARWNKPLVLANS